MHGLRALPFTTPQEIAAALPAVLAHVRARQVIAYPTETVYGFGSVANASASRRIAALKGRDEAKALLLLISRRSMLDDIGVAWTPAADRLAGAFWPGPLTLVLARALNAGSVDGQGEPSVALRLTSDAGCRALVEALDAPITSTSANRAGLPPATTAEEIVQEWHRDVSSGALLVLDGGARAATSPSSIVDCSRTPPRLLRAGAIGIEALRNAAPDLEGVI